MCGCDHLQQQCGDKRRVHPGVQQIEGSELSPSPILIQTNGLANLPAEGGLVLVCRVTTMRYNVAMDRDTEVVDEQVCALVVDDDGDMRALIAGVLLDRGHLAVTAASAEEAMANLPHFTFQVAYLDHNLPGMEGMVLGEWLRRHNPFMEIALVTGNPDERLRRLCAEHDLELIAKPFDVSELLQLPARYVERAVERHDEQSEATQWYDPPIRDFWEELEPAFDLPSIPSRIEERLERRINDALANIRSVSRYTERERVVALSGLLAARVLGIRLARGRDGKTLYEEYDDVMLARGRRKEFSTES